MGGRSCLLLLALLLFAVLPGVGATTEKGVQPRGQIAFVSDRAGENDLYVIDADGSNLRNLTANEVSDGKPVWSPDGTRVAFLCKRKGGGNICVLDVGDSSERNIPQHTLAGFPVAWSPDGTKMAFTANRRHDEQRTSLNSEILVMSAEGSHVTKLTNHSANDLSPAWSPDGTMIAFGSDREGNSDIYMMDPDGANTRRLTTAEAWDGMPVWSPDGTRIACVSYRDGNWEIYAMNADGSDQHNLTNHPASDEYPAWSPVE